MHTCRSMMTWVQTNSDANAGTPEQLIKLVQGIYRKSSSGIKVDKKITEYFHTKAGVAYD